MRKNKSGSALCWEVPVWNNRADAARTCTLDPGHQKYTAQQVLPQPPNIPLWLDVTLLNRDSSFLSTTPWPNAKVTVNHKPKCHYIFVSRLVRAAIGNTGHPPPVSGTGVLRIPEMHQARFPLREAQSWLQSLEEFILTWFPVTMTSPGPRTD